MHPNSKCKNGYLHRYQIIKVFQGGVEEQCSICKSIKFFKDTTPNHIYLSYHQRSALPREHQLFNHEYASTTTTN